MLISVLLKPSADTVRVTLSPASGAGTRKAWPVRPSSSPAAFVTTASGLEYSVTTTSSAIAKEARRVNSKAFQKQLRLTPSVF